jgi:hypothetical protein
MERDLDAKKRGYTAKSYIKALTKGLLPCWRCSYLFMQDGASIHRLRVVADFLNYYYINAIDWLPYLLDLNSIEHLWWYLKRSMYNDYP